MPGSEPIRGPQAQKATIMSVPPENDGRATAGTRARTSTGRTRAGRRWTGQAFPSLLAAAALAALGITTGAGSAPVAGHTVTGVAWHHR